MCWWHYHKKLVEEYHRNGSRESKYQKEFANVNNLTEMKSELEEMTRIDIHFLRPPFIQLFDSKNINRKNKRGDDKKLFFWSINPVYCENVTITGVSESKRPILPLIPWY
jgi:hypothetical protein